jgi:hypothetical protein
MRTHAILTKYTSLRNYYSMFGSISPPAFEVVGVYSMLLQEAYLNYKTITMDLQVLAFEVFSGRMKLVTSSEYLQQVEKAKKRRLVKQLRGKRRLMSRPRAYLLLLTKLTPSLIVTRQRRSQSRRMLRLLRILRQRS